MSEVRKRQDRILCEFSRGDSHARTTKTSAGMTDMQAKDIPERPVLEFLSRATGVGCNVWREENGTPYECSVLNAMPPETPEKVAVAKMKALMRRGLADGCPCGCRGDWTITDKGRQFLSEGLAA